MLSELKKKEILLIKGILDDYRKGIEETNAALDVIDEKYRKLIAEEKKTLKANLSEYKSQVKVYEKMFSSFDTTAVKEVLGDFESTSTDEEEPTVFDTIYPENNESDETKDTAESTELAEVTAVADAVPVDSVSATAEVDSDVAVEFPAEAVEKTVEEIDKEYQQAAENATYEEKVEFPAEWPVDEQPVVEKKEVPVLTDGENDWPDFPEDWK